MTTRVIIPSDGVTPLFSVPFPYLDRTHVRVEVAGVLLDPTEYSWVNSGTIALSVIPAAGIDVVIYRATPDEPLTIYQSGSVLTRDQLEVDSLQALYRIEELQEENLRSLRVPIGSDLDTLLPLPVPLALLGFNGPGTGITTFSPETFVAGVSAGLAYLYNVVAGQTTVDVSNIVDPWMPAGVFYNGIYQDSSAYSLSADGNTLTFTEPLPSAGSVTVEAVMVTAEAPASSDLITTTLPAAGAVTRTQRDKNADVVSLADFGFKATASAAANDAAWAAAYAEIVARGGGRIEVPGGSAVYNAVGPWTITQNGVTLRGAGRENARIDFSAGAGDGIVFTDVDYFGLENINVRNATGDGVIVQGSGPGIYATRGHLKNCVSLSNGGDGFKLDNVFLVELDGLQGNENAGYGLQFLGFHTTVHARNCQGYNNTTGGWKLNDMTYSSFDACAADLNAGQGWVLQNAQGLSFRNCGAENNGLSGWLAQASAAIASGALVPDLYGILFDGCYAVNNNTTSSGTGANFLRVEGTAANTNPAHIELVNCRDKTPGTSPSVRIKGNAKVLDRRNNFVAAFTVETFAVRQRYPQNEQTPFGKSITAANTPLLTLTDLIGNTTHYSGLLMVTARSTKWPDNLGQSASYVLHVCKGPTGPAVNVVNSAGATAGGAANHPSFTWTLDTTNNELEVSPVSLTSGNFFFNVVPVGDILPTFA